MFADVIQAKDDEVIAVNESILRIFHLARSDVRLKARVKQAQTAFRWHPCSPMAG